MIRANIRQYETKENPFKEWNYRCDDHEAIYERMMKITNNDHEVSSDAASWCELAYVGQFYIFPEGAIEIYVLD